MFGRRLTCGFSSRRCKTGKVIGLLGALLLLAACNDFAADGYIRSANGETLNLSGTYAVEYLSDAAFKLTIDLSEADFACTATSHTSKVPPAANAQAYSLLMKISCNDGRYGKLVLHLTGTGMKLHAMGTGKLSDSSEIEVVIR